jgi:hypothetical protein
MTTIARSAMLGSLLVSRRSAGTTNSMPRGVHAARLHRWQQSGKPVDARFVSRSIRGEPRGDRGSPSQLSAWKALASTECPGEPRSDPRAPHARTLREGDLAHAGGGPGWRKGSPGSPRNLNTFARNELDRVNLGVNLRPRGSPTGPSFGDRPRADPIGRMSPSSRTVQIPAGGCRRPSDPGKAHPGDARVGPGPIRRARPRGWGGRRRAK